MIKLDTGAAGCAEKWAVMVQQECWKSKVCTKERAYELVQFAFSREVLARVGARRIFAQRKACGTKLVDENLNSYLRGGRVDADSVERFVTAGVGCQYLRLRNRCENGSFSFVYDRTREVYEMNTEELDGPSLEPTEFICGYPVHPAASTFPMMLDDDFDSLVESIETQGVQVPAVVYEGQLVDGRNRMRACEKLGIKCPVVEWQRVGDITVTEWIYTTNAIRRQLSDDARAMVEVRFWDFYKKERAAKKKATHFQPGESGNPNGGPKKQVRAKSHEPAFSRDFSKENAKSTIGVIASRAGVSTHKVRQAKATNDAIKDGIIPKAVYDEVVRGNKKLREVAPKKPKTEKDGQPVVVKMQNKKAREVIPTECQLLRKIRHAIAEWQSAGYDIEKLRNELETHAGRI